MDGLKLGAAVIAVATVAGGAGYYLGARSAAPPTQTAQASEVEPPAPTLRSAPEPTLPAEPTAIPTPQPTQTPAPTPEPDKWTVDESSSSMDDTPSATLQLVSENKDRVNSYASAYAYLIIRCRENETDLYIAFDAFLGSDSISVRTRIDDEKAQDARWGISTDHKAAFARGAMALAKRLAKSNTYRVRLTPYSESPIEYEFDIRGLEQHLPKVAKACGWKM